MRHAFVLFISAALMLTSCSDTYILAHGADTEKCNPKDERYLTCGNCKDGVYKEAIIPTTVAKLMAERDTARPTFFMFFNSSCHGFPTTMPPYLAKLQRMDSITPVLVIVDDYSTLPTTRARIAAWGWSGPVHVLDQDHYGCFRFFASNRDSLVMEEFRIQEKPNYFMTVSLEVLVNPQGHVIGYSNWHDLPGELRGQHLPTY